MIPKIIHQIWVGPNPLPKREKEFCQKVQEMHPEWEYHLWTDANVPIYQLPLGAQQQYQQFYERKDYAFCADILRIWVVYIHGGIYLDVDFDCLKPLDEFLKFDGLLFHHPDAFPEADLTIVNGAFGMVPLSPIFLHVMRQIMPDGYWYGPEWFGRMIKEYLNMPYDSPHMLVRAKLELQNICYFNWAVFDRDYMKHFALYSWHPEYEAEK